MAEQDVLKRLDSIVAILRLAHGDAISAARETIRGDKVNAAVLDLASDWISAGDLKKAAVSKTKQSKPTVERRIAGLLDQGVLERQGSGAHVSYHATGLI